MQKPLSQRQVWRLRRVAFRNRIFSSSRFQSWAARIPIIRWIARRRAQRLFDLVAGFTYTQTLLATVESGLLDLLAEGVATTQMIASEASISLEAADRLVRAAAGINIAEEVAPGHWMLGEEGAALVNNAGARAMIAHHSLLYNDLSDPLALLRKDRAEPTQLSEYWRYAASDHAAREKAESVKPYSDLMAASQAMISEQVIESYPFRAVHRLLDIGGGLGVFVEAVARAYPHIELAIFDLPGVIEAGNGRAHSPVMPSSIASHAGDFFRDPLPQGYDTMSLVRILHDHDDAQAQQLLKTVRHALPEGGKLIIAEPMADIAGAESMGTTYFGWYLWAMRSGRPRNAQEITAMLETAGFTQIRRVATPQPVITSLIVATA